MHALLMAAGFGSRLGPLGQNTPKCLVDISGRPLLSFWLDILAVSPEIETIFVNTHHLAESVQRFVTQSRHSRKVVLRHESTLLGTGGTLKAFLHDVGPQDDLFVAHADNLSIFYLDDFVKAHRSRPVESVCTMMTFKTDTPQACGIVECDDHGLVVGFHEKVTNPPGFEANGAVFIFSEQALTIASQIEHQIPFEISRALIPALVGKIGTYKNTIYHRDIGSPKSLAMARADFPSFYQNFREKDSV